MNTFHVPFQVMDSRKSLVAPLTYERFFSSVSSYVCRQLLSGEKSFNTLGALVRELVQVSPFPGTKETVKDQLLSFLIPVINES